jgi:hypothetical protein
MLSSLLQIDLKPFQFQVPEAFLNFPYRPNEKRKSTEIGESSSTPVMASEESSKPSGLSPPSASGTSFGAGRVHVDAGNFPDSTATDQTPTLEDNDLLEAGVFHDSDVDIGKKCSMPETKRI